MTRKRKDGSCYGGERFHKKVYHYLRFFLEFLKNPKPGVHYCLVRNPLPRVSHILRSLIHVCYRFIERILVTIIKILPFIGDLKDICFPTSISLCYSIHSAADG